MSGRGGAGNILRVQEQSKKAAEDLEAQNPSTPNPTPAPKPSSSTPQPYAHTGRGGAGNWYQPSSLAQSGTFSSPTDSTALPSSDRPNVSTPWHPEGQELPVGRAGRGGAGNFVWGDAEGEKARREEERRRGEVRAGVEREVERGLERPGAVVLGGVKGGRGW